MLAAVVVGLWWGHQAHLLSHLGGDARPGESGSLDDAAIRHLATRVQAEQVVMYSTTECGYCTQARAWLQHYGFAYTECNMSVDSRCADAFHAYGADGTPFLVLRGPRGEHRMKNGFDSDEFLAALTG